MKRGKINVVIDGQWGSTGKGKMVGYLALKYKPEVAVCNFMTNAGHTFVDDHGKDFFFQQIPVSAVNPSTKLYLACSSGITLSTFWKEIERLEASGLEIRSRLRIDKHAFVIDEQHAEQEKIDTVSIASTMKGCGTALMGKISRKAGAVRLAKDVPELLPFIDDIPYLLFQQLKRGTMVMGETAQGFDLSLNHGHTYPYVTSRDVTPMQFMNDCGIPASYLGDVYGVIRYNPIRVGNVFNPETGKQVGYSGDFYPDQLELNWDLISKQLGKDVKELTSVTKRVRRVFSFSYMQYSKFLRVCEPTHICLNFANYIKGIDDKTTIPELEPNQEFRFFVEHTKEKEQKILGRSIPMVLVGVGARNSDVIDLIEEGNRAQPIWMHESLRTPANPNEEVEPTI